MPESTMTSTAGLFTTGEIPVPVPLVGVSIDADLCGFYAKVVVAHRYVNRENSPIEAVYVFPLEEGAAVCAFEAVVAGTRVVGEMHERDRAFELYDDAIEAGHGAFLLDEERPDIFQASIGNLPPGAEVIVTLTYVAELTVDDGRLRFAIPTTVSPRYAPIEDQVGTGRPDSAALNPPHALSVPYGLNLSVHAAMPQGITAIESPSHPIALTLDEQGATITLAQQDAALDGDFILSISAPGLDAPQALLDRDNEGTEAVGVAFAPVFPASSAPGELIFLVDRSGSMGGASIEEMRNALQLCLRSMTSGCRFNIVGFGTRYQSLFPESRPYDQATLDVATAHVATIEADLGGTELLPALRFVLEGQRSGELPRHVVVLTDGEVTNTDAVIELAAAHAHHARIFTFGIGTGASQHLVRGVARAGGGAAEFIYPGERIEPKVVRQLSRLLSPALTDVRVEWIGGTVTQAPVKIPAVFAGGRLLVYGFVKGQRPAMVRLTATTPSGPVSFEVPVPDVAAGSHSSVRTLAARARIRELEEGSEWLSARGSQQKDRKVTSAKNEIIALSLRYGVISRETSFVAVERRDTPVTADVQLRKIPIALTTGWGGLGRPAVPTLKLASSARLSPPLPREPHMSRARRSTFGSARDVSAPLSRPSPPDHLGLGSLDSDDGSAPRVSQNLDHSRRQTGVGGARSRGDALIVLQRADGSWDLTVELASLLGRDLQDLRAAVPPVTGPAAQGTRAWATALAIAWLDRHAADRKDEWHLVVEKARNWIQVTTAMPSDGRTWTAIATDYLAR